jgi:hypothetical protein
MNRIKLSIIRLGESKHKDAWNFIDKLKIKKKSNLFEVIDIQEISLPQAELWGYSDAYLTELIKHSKSADYTLCFIDYPLEELHFVRRLSEKVGVATFCQTNQIFENANIDLKNFILLQIYRVVVLSKLDIGDDMSSIWNHSHTETRGCLFDFCELKTDIIVSAVSPKICFDCEAKLRKTQIDTDFIESLEKELKYIRKSLYFRITDWIKKHPLCALLITLGSTVVINILSMWLFGIIFS